MEKQEEESKISLKTFQKNMQLTRKNSKNEKENKLIQSNTTTQCIERLNTFVKPNITRNLAFNKTNIDKDSTCIQQSTIQETSEKLYSKDIIRAHCLQSSMLLKKIENSRIYHEELFMKEITSYFYDILRIQTEYKELSITLNSLILQKYLSILLPTLNNRIDLISKRSIELKLTINNLCNNINISSGYIFTNTFKCIDHLRNIMNDIELNLNKIDEFLDLDKIQFIKNCSILEKIIDEIEEINNYLESLSYKLDHINKYSLLDNVMNIIKNSIDKK